MLERSREFIELAIQLNFTTAAERLHVSTSALSRHIADLESELGVALFHRSPLSLTPAGEFYLESISAIIDELDVVTARCRRIGQNGERPFTIYILPGQTLLHEVVYEAASLLRQKNPGLTTAICVDDRYLTTQEALLAGKADVGIVYEWSLEACPEITQVHIGSLPVCAWVLKSSPLASRASLSLSELAEYAHPCSTNRQSLAATDSTRGRFAASGLNLKTHLKNAEDRAAFYLTLRPDEFFIDFEEDLGPLCLNPDLIQVPFEPPVISTLYLAYRSDDESPELLQYIDVCKQLAEQRGLSQSV